MDNELAMEQQAHKIYEHLAESGKTMPKQLGNIIRQMLSKGMPPESIIKNILEGIDPSISQKDMEFLQESGQTMPNMGRQMMAGGGTPFPDLTGDGQVTQADILKGRGVEFAEGGEAIGDDLAGMAMSEEEAMAEVGNAEKEMAMIQQLVTVVQQLLAEGISEDDLVAFLKEQGLDDEDIDSLMQMVLQSQSEQAPNQIGQELQGMM